MREAFLRSAQKGTVAYDNTGAKERFQFSALGSSPGGALPILV